MSQRDSVTDRRPVRERWKDGDMKRGEMAVDEKGRKRWRTKRWRKERGRRGRGERKGEMEGERRRGEGGGRYVVRDGGRDG